MAEETNLSFVLGEDWFIDFALNDDAGDDLNLTGATVKIRLSRRKVFQFELTSAGDDVTVDSPSEGNGTIRVEPDQQAGIVPAVYEYEVRVVLSDASVSTQAFGSLEVKRSLF